MFTLFANDILVPIITITSTIVVAILAYIAQGLAKAGDLSIEIKRHAFLDARDVRLGIRFYSTKKKVHEFRNIVLAAEINGVLTIISGESLTPIVMADDKGMLTTSELGYKIKITDGSTFDGVFHFVIPRNVDASSIKVAYLVAVDRNGHKVKAAFDFKSTDAQAIYFKRLISKKDKK